MTEFDNCEILIWRDRGDNWGLEAFDKLQRVSRAKISNVIYHCVHLLD
jgi:hypothetical protein